ncbi:hypothetical protein [uncultured Treponema sp.]|mgnify:CR=1 FL=1|uniref:hypothetical protein n=1 Tax=uncultured Treponema sp. TaxID=162155 RepID=UPI0025E36105|nr:hypothetical protein [uncultured Treponema sp.]
MKKNIVIVCFIFIILIIAFCKRIICSRKADIELTNWNSAIYAQNKGLNLKSILYYEHSLYFQNEIGPKDFRKISLNNEIPLKYGMSRRFDTDLMPIVFSDKIALCQPESLKIYSTNKVFEYICNNQIVSITFPKLENDKIIIYAIKFDSSKHIYSVPASERKWILQEIVFSNGKFSEKTITNFYIPEIYTIKKVSSDVNFFRYSKGIIDIVLTDLNERQSIYKFSDKGKFIEKENDGFLIIPNKFNDNFLWYIKEPEENKFYLMKNDEEICELDYLITQGHFVKKSVRKELKYFIIQGHFVKESAIEFFFYDVSETAYFDFINGLLAPRFSSALYMINKKELIPVYYKDYNEELEKKILFKDKIRHDNILIVY